MMEEQRSKMRMSGHEQSIEVGCKQTAIYIIHDAMGGEREDENNARGREVGCTWATPVERERAELRERERDTIIQQTMRGQCNDWEGGIQYLR